jgi:hypothetical protein
MRPCGPALEVSIHANAIAPGAMTLAISHPVRYRCNVSLASASVFLSYRAEPRSRFSDPKLTWTGSLSVPLARAIYPSANVRSTLDGTRNFEDIRMGALGEYKKSTIRWFAGSFHLGGFVAITPRLNSRDFAMSPKHECARRCWSRVSKRGALVLKMEQRMDVPVQLQEAKVS